MAFGPYTLRGEAWEGDYGSETPLASLPFTPPERVQLDVEVPEAEWDMVTPPAAVRPEQMFFVDGIRRLEKRVQAWRGSIFRPGAFGSFAVGAACCTPEQANFHTLRAERLLVIADSEVPGIGEYVIRNGLKYRVRQSNYLEPDGPLREIQSCMRAAEGRLARELAESQDALVVADGPLTFEKGTRGSAVGFIKRIAELYLPEEHYPLLTRLDAGTRTPIFAIEATGHGFSRLSWFQRLAPPQPSDSLFHGLVRLEVHAAVGLAEARRLADSLAPLLPQFAPTRGRDPRSPQNLLPIGALEQRLRRELGDQNLQRRWIEERLHEDSYYG